MSGRRTANRALATARTARPRSTARRVRRGGAVREALWFTPPGKTKGRCGGVCVFRYAGDTRVPRHRETGASRQRNAPPPVTARPAAVTKDERSQGRQRRTTASARCRGPWGPRAAGRRAVSEVPRGPPRPPTSLPGDNGDVTHTTVSNSLTDCRPRTYFAPFSTDSGHDREQRRAEEATGNPAEPRFSRHASCQTHSRTRSATTPSRRVSTLGLRVGRCTSNEDSP